MGFAGQTGPIHGGLKGSAAAILMPDILYQHAFRGPAESRPWRVRRPAQYYSRGSVLCLIGVYLCMPGLTGLNTASLTTSAQQIIIVHVDLMTEVGALKYSGRILIRGNYKLESAPKQCIKQLKTSFMPCGVTTSTFNQFGSFLSPFVFLVRFFFLGGGITFLQVKTALRLKRIHIDHSLHRLSSLRSKTVKNHTRRDERSQACPQKRRTRRRVSTAASFRQ